MARKKKIDENSVIRTGRKKSWDDRLFEIIVYTILIVMFLFFLYPIWYVLIASFSDPDAVYTGKVVLFPIGFNADSYGRVFRNKDIWIGYGNTIFYTVLGTVCNVLATIMLAYGVSRRDLKGRQFILTLFIVTMYFSGGMIPAYLNMKSLGLVNTRLYMIISGLVGPTNIIICRTYFSNSIPWELQEAAFIDGASDWYVFRKIVMPLSRAIMAVMSITYAVGHWNAYFNAMVYLKDSNKFPLQVFLRDILIKSNMASMLLDDTDPEFLAALAAAEKLANQMKFSVIVVAVVPLLCIYPFVEKYFDKGFMIGGVKG
ncbi:MAG: carbohydrate ABC transporter permease [Lachnospiraceae bacterium]|nr:carbohydrate ABC transporter permease [Lachnospiraceae bacterium]